MDNPRRNDVRTQRDCRMLCYLMVCQMGGSQMIGYQRDTLECIIKAGHHLDACMDKCFLRNYDTKFKI